MGFHHHARKVRDPRRPPWKRFSSLKACVASYCWCTGLRFRETMARFGLPLDDWWTPRPPPDDAFLLGVLEALEKERNEFLDRLRAFERRRIRAKMRGARQLSKAERDARAALRRAIGTGGPDESEGRAA